MYLSLSQLIYVHLFRIKSVLISSYLFILKYLEHLMYGMRSRFISVRNLIYNYSIYRYTYQLTRCIYRYVFIPLLFIVSIANIRSHGNEFDKISEHGSIAWKPAESTWSIISWTFSRARYFFEARKHWMHAIFFIGVPYDASITPICKWQKYLGAGDAKKSKTIRIHKCRSPNQNLQIESSRSN